MSVAFDHRDPGTPESAWAESAPWRTASPLALDVDAVLVVAAHPDDETLGAGGLLAHCHEQGIAVHTVIVTDGGAAHPEVGDDPDLARARRREAVEALSDLAPSSAVTFLGFADGRVREDRAAIARALGSILSAHHGRRVLIAAPWWGDGHRDHRVLGEIALDLAGDAVEVAGYPLWFWHWATPSAADATQWQVLTLTDAQRRRKARAIARHRSQVEARAGEAIVHDGMRAHFLRGVEVFVGAGAERAGVDTAFFDDVFARHDDPWGFASRWYEQRKRALVLASLPRARFASALELGCATGVLTAELSERCDALLGVDAAAAAVAAARERTASSAHVRIAQRRLPGDWPDGAFDLIVVSELAYYLARDDRAALTGRIRSSLADDGVVVACHWRRPIADAPATGDRVHAELAGALGLHTLARHEEADFLLEVFARDPGSVGERESLA